MIWKVKDINKEQVITVVLHLLHLIYVSYLWHILPCNQADNFIFFFKYYQRDLFLTLDFFYFVKVPKGCPLTVNVAITALIEKSQISYCTAPMVVPQ